MTGFPVYSNEHNRKKASFWTAMAGSSGLRWTPLASVRIQCVQVRTVDLEDDEGGFGRNYGAVHDAEQKVPKCFSLWSTNEAEDFSLHSLIYRVSYNHTSMFLSISITHFAPS